MLEEIMRVIRSRESARGPFDLKRPVSDRDLEQILEAGSWAPTAHNMQNFEIIAVDDPETLQALGRLRNPISMDFIRENYAQLSFSEEELRRKRTGVLASRFPPAWSNPAATPEELSAAYRPLPASPIMLFVTYDPSRRAPASDGDFLGVISLGCVTENMWLMATSLGIGFHIVSSLASGAVETDVKRLLAIPPALRIVYAIRLGHPVSPAGPSPVGYLRVRRAVADFAHRNLYGRRRE